MIFLDTSAIYAMADVADANCVEANARFEHAWAQGETLVTHNYVLVESVALLHRRLGRAVAARFHRQAERVELVWIDRAMHDAAFTDFAKRPGRRVSFVDCVSFGLMRTRKITRALAFDDDFRREGFTLYDGK